MLFSTLNPYPFWAGSENLWFDFVRDERLKASHSFKVMLADSPVTRQKGNELKEAGVEVGYYKHFNVDFTRRNLFKLADKLSSRNQRTLPWYKEISKGKYDLVFFNVSTHADLLNLSYAVTLCKKYAIPYWLLLQHGYEDFFLATEEELDITIDVATSARRFIFIAKKNRHVLERAIGQKLINAIDTVNAITAKKIEEAGKISLTGTTEGSGKARFFNLGRFAPKDKAQHLLLECFAVSQWKTRDWELNFIGVSGFGRLYLEKLINFYALDTRQIRILPHTDNVFAEIVKNDVLLMPSMSEGTPFAMIESMACGRPAFGTPVGGISELIRDGVTGWLSKTVAIEDISEALERVWAQKNEWKQMGERAAGFIQTNYNQQVTFPKLIELLQEDTK